MNRLPFGRILAYHTIDRYATPLPAGINTSPEAFHSHMQWLKHRWRVVPLHELVDTWLLAGKKTPRNVVSITFDDAYQDNYEYAYPILRDLELPATIFCVTAYLDTVWPASDWGGIEKTMLTTKQMNEMQAHGISLESHSHTHLHLDTLQTDQLRDELATSRNALASRLGAPPRFLAYPFGAHNDAVMAAARDAGYDAAFAVWTPTPSRYALARVPVHTRDIGLRFRLKLRWYTWLKRLRGGA